MTSLIGNPRVILENMEILNEHYWRKSVKFSKIEHLFGMDWILLTFANTFMSSGFSLYCHLSRSMDFKIQVFSVTFASEMRVLCIPPNPFPEV